MIMLDRLRSKSAPKLNSLAARTALDRPPELLDRHHLFAATDKLQPDASAPIMRSPTPIRCPKDVMPTAPVSPRVRHACRFDGNHPAATAVAAVAIATALLLQHRWLLTGGVIANRPFLGAGRTGHACESSNRTDTSLFRNHSMKTTTLLIAGTVAIMPLAGALAQGTSPDLRAGSTKEANQVEQGSATNPRKPGATGSTVVPGSHSTIAGDRNATARRQTDGGGGGKQ
jgi:hypothetical protein